MHSLNFKSALPQVLMSSTTFMQLHLGVGSKLAGRFVALHMVGRIETLGHHSKFITWVTMLQRYVSH